MYNLARFGFTEMMECRSRLRELLLDPEPQTQEEAAQRIVGFLYQNLVDEQNRPACAMVRMFKTQRFDSLDQELRTFVRHITSEADQIAHLRCLVLLATAGMEPAWNSRRSSRGHKAIPLASEQMVEKAPMIAQLIKQFGAEISTVLRPDAALLLASDMVNFDVFHVAEAEGSPYIPSQDFVKRYEIRSVVGFGGMVTTGDLFAAILFSRVPITTEVAQQFTVIGLNLKLGILPTIRKPLFTG